jgi:hypothetical protein
MLCLDLPLAAGPTRIYLPVTPRPGDTLQERVIKAGWSPLWEKYGKADPK